MDKLFVPLDIYCEQINPGLWSEPINAVTNILILAAGFLGLWQVRVRKTGTFAELLCWWVVGIGLGSLLFHTTALELTKWADIVPIATFTLAMMLFALRRFARLSWARTLVYSACYFVFIAIVTYLLPNSVHAATNGTTFYLPALGGNVFCGLVALANRGPGGWYALACAGILLVGFFFRAIDQEVCASFPIGTHFLWHVLIAAMLALNLLGVARHGAPLPKSA